MDTAINLPLWFSAYYLALFAQRESCLLDNELQVDHLHFLFRLRRLEQLLLLFALLAWVACFLELGE